MFVVIVKLHDRTEGLDKFECIEHTYQDLEYYDREVYVPFLP